MMDLTRATEARARHQENKGRLGQHHELIKTDKLGTRVVNRPIEFATVFTERPIFSYGSEFDLEEIEDLHDTDPPKAFPVPLSAGHVVDWTVDRRGLWIGATVALSIHVVGDAAFPAGTKFPMIHHLLFTARAMKDVSMSGMTDDQPPLEQP